MPWNGIRDNATDVGDGQSIIENCSFFVQNELRQRPGLGGRFAQTGLVVAEQGAYLIYVESDGDIVSNDGSTPTTLMSGYNVVVRPCMQPAFGRMYITNDFDAVRVSDDGITIRTAGIVAPSSPPAIPGAGAGDCTIGTHLLRYRWYDSRRMRYSDPSDSIEVVVPAFGTISIIPTKILSGDATVDTIIWEMTPAGEGTYYQAATDTNTAGTTTIDISDPNLVNRTPAAAYGDYGHNPPPLSSLICEHQGYLFFWGATSRVFTNCTVTNGSPTITGVGFSTQWAGRQVVVTGTAGTFYVSSATTTDITLTGNFTGTTSAVATITVSSGAPNLLQWSRPGQPESCDATSQARLIALPAGDAPAAMMSLHGDLYLIGTRSVVRLNMTGGLGDPATGTLVPVPSSLGAFHQRGVVSDAGNLAFGWGRDGMWLIDAMLPKRISDPILTTVGALIDTTRLVERFVVFEPTERAALFFFCLSGDTACKAAAAYYPDSNTWQLWKYRQPMTAGCINNYTDRARLLVVDSNASSWRVGVNVNDGCDNGVIAAGSGSTTTVINGTFAQAVVGMVIYRPATAEERYITANSGTTITVGVAFATAPATDETLYLGSVRQRIRLDWSIGEGTNDKKHPRYLLLSVRATEDMGTCSVYLYKDYNETPITVTSSQSDEFPYGVTPISGTAEIRIDLDLAVVDGFVSIPVFSDWARAISAELIHEAPEDSVRYLDMSWKIVAPADEAEVEGE